MWPVVENCMSQEGRRSGSDEQGGTCCGVHAHALVLVESGEVKASG
jgi:hypothetical protein